MIEYLMFETQKEFEKWAKRHPRKRTSESWVNFDCSSKGGMGCKVVGGKLEGWHNMEHMNRNYSGKEFKTLIPPKPIDMFFKDANANAKLERS